VASFKGGRSGNLLTASPIRIGTALSSSACIFCQPDHQRAFIANELAYAIWDAFPVTEGHALIVPKRHAVDYFDLTPMELLACDDLLRQTRELLITRNDNIRGFNVGANAGAAAGQTIFHCHLHLIPRRTGDVENPRGGVRHVIPGKGFY
jgi:ATP adenylyltransferase